MPSALGRRPPVINNYSHLASLLESSVLAALPPAASHTRRYVQLHCYSATPRLAAYFLTCLPRRRSSVRLCIFGPKALYKSVIIITRQLNYKPQWFSDVHLLGAKFLILTVSGVVFPHFYPSIHPCLFLRKKSNQKYGTYISTIKILSGATRHSSVLITTPLKGKE